MVQLEDLFAGARNWFLSNKRAIFWIVSIGLMIYACLLVKEVTVLLLLSYGIAILIEPLVSKLEARKVPRGVGVFLILGGITAVVLLLVLLIVPTIVSEYADVIARLPRSLDSLASSFNRRFSRFGIKSPQSTMQWASTNVSAIGPAQIQQVLQAVLTALLRGYSITLTFINVLLLPFFVFYIACDLPKIHRFIRQILPPPMRIKVVDISQEILEVIHSFFRGQFTVSILMGLLYGLGLSLLGIPAGFAVGLLAGMLNVVPYLGLLSGIFLATLLALAEEPSFLYLILVWGVFGFVQLLEGTILTPKIVGRSVGLHPMGVMLALIVGGQLLGLAGLVLAIPGAAALRVLFRRLRAEVEEPA